MDFLSVIPLCRTLDSVPFTYLCPPTYREHVQIGSLVEIPIGKKLEHGVVMAISHEGSPEYEGEIKTISGVLASAPVLALYQMEAIVQFAIYTYQPIYKVALLFLPKSFVTFLARYSFRDLLPLPRKRAEISKRFVTFHRDGAVNAEVIESHIHDRKTVIIFPDTFLLTAFLTATHSGEDILHAPPHLTPTQRSRLWIAIQKGEKKIVAGTRRLLFFDLSAYDQILYIEDAFVDSYFQYPLRFRYLDILASFGPSSPDITILSSAPSLYALTRLPDFTRT